MIIGEHIISRKRIVRRFVKNMLKGRLKFDLFKEFYNHDDLLGDHYYTLDDYKFTFYAYGYEYKLLKSQVRDSSVFIAQKG